jgi:hypothetical protein
MKAILTILSFALVTGLASCKKDWTCQCTDNNGDNVYHDVPNATIGDANRTCIDFEKDGVGSYSNCSVIH